MATIALNGAISGLDTAALVNALAAADQLPITRLQVKRTEAQDRQKAYTKLDGLIADLQTALKAFTSDRSAGSKLAASSDATRFTATASANALTASYSVAVTRLATPTRATSTASIGTGIGETEAASPAATLPLPGTLRAGTLGIVVDGRIVEVTIPDPATASLRDIADAIAAGVQVGVQGTAGAESATVTAAFANNRLELSVAGSSVTHEVSFGVGGSTSNAAALLGLTTADGSAFASGSPITGANALGVVQTSVPLDSAGLTGLTAGAGTLTINGATIAYDTTADSLATVISRINTSTAGVIASLDRTNDRLVIANKSGGPTAIAITDTAGTLAAALHLEPGTTAAQVLGERAALTVDGRPVETDSNRVATAIDGVTLELLGTGTSTLTVSSDREGAIAAVKKLVEAYNALASGFEDMTVTAPGQPRGALAGEAGIRDLLTSVRRQLTSSAPGLAGAITSLSSVGITTGTIGSAVGSTSRLQFDEIAFEKAIDADPTRVADLLDSANGILKPVVDRLTAVRERGGLIDLAQESLAASIKEMDARQLVLEQRRDDRKAALERRYAQLELRLAQLQSAQSAAAAQIGALPLSSSGDG